MKQVGSSEKEEAVHTSGGKKRKESNEIKRGDLDNKEGERGGKVLLSHSKGEKRGNSIV